VLLVERLFGVECGIGLSCSWKGASACRSCVNDKGWHTELRDRVARCVLMFGTAMTIDQIQSKRVREIIAGSPTPASDLRDQAGSMSVADFREACGYYGGYSKLVSAAVAEHNFCQERDI